MEPDYDELPTVYSCSGCSTAAQMANDVAVRLDRNQRAEMSCIAGVGGDVEPLVRDAVESDTVVAIDGCPLNCALSCLRKHDVSPDIHVELSSWGVEKNHHEDYDERKMKEIYQEIVEELDALQR